MIIKDIIDIIDSLAPPGVAWDKDNPGLQVGNPDRELTGLVLTLDFNIEALNLAKQKKCNFIISHHPFIFKPLTNLDTRYNTGILTEQLIKNNITLFSAHTNLDFSKGGVSHALAEMLNLSRVKFLKNSESNQYKLITFSPIQYSDFLISKLSHAGAGIIGEYSHCSFKSSGTGTFFGSQSSNPTVGQKEQLEQVDEVRVEIVFNKWNKNKIVSTLLEFHPYEEPAFDIYPLENSNQNFGFGVVGYLEKEMTGARFLEHVSNSLKAPFLRWSKGSNQKINKIAVCGGSGRELTMEAIRQGCDAYVSADFDYHTFLDHAEKIMLVDAGHYQTEVPVLTVLEKLLKKQSQKNKKKFNIYKSYPREDKIKFYNNIRRK